MPPPPRTAGTATRTAAKITIFRQNYPSGRLNVLPALGYSNGCFVFLANAYSSIFALISSLFPFLSAITPSKTTYSFFKTLLVR